MEAQKKLVRDQMKHIQAARLAMADNASYSNVIAQLEMTLKEIEFGKERAAMESWGFLKKLKRG